MSRALKPLGSRRHGPVNKLYIASANRIVRVREKDIKVQVLNHFGWKCECCGSEVDLELDHVHGNGLKHRETFGAHLYQWLINNNFPAECEPGGAYELQVLCSSCNGSKGSGLHCAIHIHPIASTA